MNTIASEEAFWPQLLLLSLYLIFLAPFDIINGSAFKYKKSRLKAF